MDTVDISELEQLGRVAAQGLDGAKAVEDVKVVIGEDSLDRPAYFFSFLINERGSGEQAGLTYIRLIQRLRDALLAQGDSHYPIIKILNRDEWKKRAIA